MLVEGYPEDDFPTQLTLAYKFAMIALFPACHKGKQGAGQTSDDYLAGRRASLGRTAPARPCTWSMACLYPSSWPILSEHCLLHEALSLSFE